MLSLKPTTSKKIYLFLISSVIITAAVITALFLGYHRNLQGLIELETDSPPAGKQPDITINKVHQTSTRDGITEWSLDADSAAFTDENNQAILKNLSVTFFLKNNQKIYLTAGHGVLDTRLNDIEVSGNVIVTHHDILLKTENLTYLHAKRLLLTKVPVNIRRGTFNVTADSMSFDLNTNRALFKGHVGGCFSENAISG